MSEGGWARRHDRYHLAYHGRSRGEIRLLAWSIDDCAVPWASLCLKCQEESDRERGLGGFGSDLAPAA